MSAPDTNLKKQEKRHWGPIAGITLAIIVAILWMFFWSGAEEVTDADAQDGAAEIQATVDGDGDGTVENMAEEEGADTPIDDSDVEAVTGDN